MSKRSQRSAAPAVPAASLAERATDALRLGRFKDAIELLKQLIKQDPRPEWRNFLADAYAGRARALAAKGMFKEAEIVLGNTAAPDGTVREPLLYLQCLIRQGLFQRAAAHAFQYAGTGKASASEAPQLAELAAALSLAVPVPLDAPADQNSERAKWVEQAVTAQQALTAWIEGRSEQEIDPLLSRIPLRSPFKALRLILKSLITAPQNPERARQLLEGIPAESAFASFRLAVAAALPGEPPDLLDRSSGSSAAQQSFVAEVSGLPAAAFQTLAQLGAAERSGPAARFDFLVKRAADLPAADARSACLNLLPRCPDRLPHFEKAFGPLPEFEKHRLLALAAEARCDWSRAERYWRSAAATIELGQEKEAKLSAGVIYRHLALLARENPEVEEVSGNPAIFYLQRSLDADPDHLPAILQLIGLYRREGRDKAWHLLAEEAAHRFPEESAILLEAVNSAAARKAYKKAAGFARSLLILDPINQPARLRMIELQVSQARKQMRSKRADLAWQELLQAAEWERSDAPNFLLRINQGLVGLQLDQGTEAESRLRDGVRLAGGGVPGWFRAALEDVLMKGGKTGAALLRQELTKAQETAPAKPAILSIASATSSQEARDNEKAVAGLVLRIRGWLLKGSSIAWSAAEFHPVGEMLRQADAFDLLGNYAKLASRRAPEDPTWRFYQLVARTKDDPSRLSFRETEELFDMAEEAWDRQDFHAANRIHRFVDDLGAAAAARRGARRPIPHDEPGRDDPLMELLALTLEDTPPGVVAELVADLGKDKAIKAVIGRIRKSPLGQMLPNAAVLTLAEGVVDSVIGSGGEPYF
jgi:hypothetical protein